MKVRKELNATSSQSTSLQNGPSCADNMINYWSSWRRTVRTHNLVLKYRHRTFSANSACAESSTDSTKTTFDSTVTTLRWIATNGLRMFLQFWYSKQAMFWIPKGWVPYYAEWLLSFPRAPLGSVSMQAWSLACGAIILLVSDAIVAIVALAMGAGSQKAKPQPMKVPSEKAGAGEKKEL